MNAPTVLLVGNPNSGKTTLFNRLTGLFARVGNYPGITVEHREGKARLGAHTALVIDVPGTYSLLPRSEDEAVAVRGVLGRLPDTEPADVIVVVVDASALERNLYLLSQLRELPLPIVVALTMTDTLRQDGLAIDAERLSRHLGCPVVDCAGDNGIDALKKVLGAQLSTPRPRLAKNPPAIPGDDDPALQALGKELEAQLGLAGSAPALSLLGAQALAVAAFDRLPLSTPRGGWPPVTNAVEHSARIIAARYERVREWTEGVIVASAQTLQAPYKQQALHKERRSDKSTRVVDALALHPLFGPILLVAVFFLLFEALFSAATPVMDFVQGWVAELGKIIGGLIPDNLPLVRSLIEDGVFAGVGNVIVFVPQIAILFLFLAVLEDSGYLARAAFLLDRLMAGVGLHGRAFVPLLSGFACAVPAIMATRTIESNKDRLVTILVTPLVSCSARLPVYALMIATVFSTLPPVFGVISAGALVMVAMYGLSIGAAIGMAAVFKRTLLKSPTPPLVLELPPYRWPQPLQLWKAVATRVRTFLVEAGTVILTITIVLWGLFTFPRDQAVIERRDAAVAVLERDLPAGAQRETRIRALEGEAAQQLIDASVAGRVGHLLEPVLAPLGFDWKLGVGILASFAAREVLVSTLGLVYGLGSDATEESASLRDAMRADRRQDGTPLYTPLVGLSLLVFFVLAMQCMSTLATVKRETGGWKWPAFQFAYMSVLAYGAALLVFQGGRLLGFA